MAHHEIRVISTPDQPAAPILLADNGVRTLYSYEEKNPHANRKSIE